MSYYSPINFKPMAVASKESNQKPNEKTNVKNKFFTRLDPSKDVPGHNLLLASKASSIDAESALITPTINSKDKVQLKLKNEFNPSDYSLNYTDNLQNFPTQKTGFYYNNKDTGAGRGFGNLDVSNDIRSGDASRTDTKEFKEYRESQQLFEFQFQYLDRNVQDPNHLVMSIPRGGETTRKQNQLSVNTMRKTINFENSANPTNTSNDLLKTIKFEY